MAGQPLVYAPTVRSSSGSHVASPLPPALVRSQIGHACRCSRHHQPSCPLGERSRPSRAPRACPAARASRAPRRLAASRETSNVGIACALDLAIASARPEAPSKDHHAERRGRRRKVRASRARVLAAKTFALLNLTQLHRTTGSDAHAGPRCGSRTPSIGPRRDYASRH
jgi:hypothetical protein